MIVLFDGQDEDASSSAKEWLGGVGTLVAWGTFGSGTLKLQFRPAGESTWIDVGVHTELTADGIANFEIHAVGDIRANLASSTNPDLDVIVGKKEGTLRLSN